MRASDSMLARYAGEIEEKQAFLDGLVEKANEEGRDLTEQEMELATRSRDRIKTVNDLMQPLEEARRISNTSAERLAELAKFMGEDKAPVRDVQYRSAGAYILDYWKGSLGAEEAMHRLDLYNRATTHQTTADNPGLIPTPIVQPVINFIDTARPLTSWLGPKQIPSGSWTRPKVTQHTSVAEQPVGEKNELVSQKLLISKQNVAAKTYGGYVNVSRQDIDWSSPGIMDIIIQDLAGKFGTVTEAALGAALSTAAPITETVATGTPTVAALNAALWEAAGLVYAATAGTGRLAMFMPPDQLGVWAPLFAPVNPTNAISSGFEAADFAAGAMGSISGVPVYMTAGLPAGSSLVLSSAAAEVYEDRIGALQVVEPSVLGVQVAYAGYFTWLVIETAGLAKIVKTP